MNIRLLLLLLELLLVSRLLLLDEEHLLEDVLVEADLVLVHEGLHGTGRLLLTEGA